jgi:hypothetical protein
MIEQERRDDFSPVYSRELPGGGFVAIDVKRERGDHEHSRTRVCVERRGRYDRRVGHGPIVIAEADGDEYSPGFTELYNIAADNAAIARALLQLGTTHPERAD